jgi:hypothetical protein
MLITDIERKMKGESINDTLLLTTWNLRDLANKVLK